MRRQFTKYFIIGITAFVLDIGSLYLLKEYGHFSPVISIVLNQVVILNLVFYLNKIWSFRSSGQTRQQIIKFYLLAATNYLISIIWMWVWHNHLQINYLIARITNIILAVAWNFLLYRYWVYRNDPDSRLLIPPS
ncbi:MAG: GtrA family protein [Patescibacteria group bacterium]